MRYFHFSANTYEPGFVLTSPRSRGQRSIWDGHMGGRSDVVYVFDQDALAGMDFDPPWAPHLYEVQPLGPIEPDPEQISGLATYVTLHSWITTSATVVEEIDIEAVPQTHPATPTPGSPHGPQDTR